MLLYLTSLTKGSIDKINFKGKKKVAFIATAADPYEDRWFVEDDRKALQSKGLEIVYFYIKDYDQEQLYEELSKFEIMFFSGGNSHYLLEKIKRSGFDKIVRKLLDQGIIYIGSSAGSVVACPSIEFCAPMDHPEEAPNLKDFSGLNLVDFYLLPHYGREKYAKICEQILQDNKDLEVVPVRDDQLIVVEDTDWKIV